MTTIKSPENGFKSQSPTEKKITITSQKLVFPKKGKEKSRTFFNQILKMKKIKNAIEKFKERIVFRKMDSLKAFHFNIINDQCFVLKENNTDLVS